MTKNSRIARAIQNPSLGGLASKAFRLSLFLFIPFFPGARVVTRVVSDYKDYWKPDGCLLNRVKPANSHNLLVFNCNGVPYSGNGKSMVFQSPPPVRYSFFKGVLAGKEVDLSWQTNSEVNANEFVVERSGDGHVFSAIGSLPARNGMNAVNDYLFADVKPLPGTGFYRIRQTDMDGTTTTTGIIKIENDASGLAVNVYPIPSRNWIYIGHPPASGTETIVIYNASGIELGRQHPAKAEVQTRTDIRHLAPGSYYLVYKSSNERSVAKFVVN